MTPANGDGVPDLNVVPLALVESVEIITGGASAVYGSDAIADPSTSSPVAIDCVSSPDARGKRNATTASRTTQRPAGKPFAEGRGSSMGFRAIRIASTRPRCAGNFLPPTFHTWARVKGRPAQATASSHRIPRH